MLLKLVKICEIILQLIKLSETMVCRTSFALDGDFLTSTPHTDATPPVTQHELSLILQGTRCTHPSVYQLNKIFKRCSVVELDVSVCQVFY